MLRLIVREAVTSSNYGPIASVVTWILVVSMILAVLAKVAMKLLTSQAFGVDDGVLLSAMVYHWILSRHS